MFRISTLLLLLIILVVVQSGHYVHDYYKCQGDNYKRFKKCKNYMNTCEKRETFNLKYYLIFMALSKQLWDPGSPIYKY